MTRFFSLIAMATVVAVISFAASWATSQPIWLTAVLISSGVLATGFVQSMSRGSLWINDAEDGTPVPTLAIRFTIGALTLACMTTSMLWFAGLTNS